MSGKTGAGPSHHSPSWMPSGRRPLDVSHLDGPLAALAVVRRARRQAPGRTLEVVGLEHSGLAAVRSWAATAGHRVESIPAPSHPDERSGLRIDLAPGTAPGSAPAWWQRDVEQTR